MLPKDEPGPNVAPIVTGGDRPDTASSYARFVEGAWIVIGTAPRPVRPLGRGDLRRTHFAGGLGLFIAVVVALSADMAGADRDD